MFLYLFILVLFILLVPFIVVLFFPLVEIKINYYGGYRYDIDGDAGTGTSMGDGTVV